MEARCDDEEAKATARQQPWKGRGDKRVVVQFINLQSGWEQNRLFAPIQ